VLFDRDSARKSGAAYPWILVGFLWLTYLLNYGDREAIFSIFPILRKQLHFSETQLGLTGSTFVWTYSLCMPLTGCLADLIRRERLVIGSLILWSLATLGTGLSSSVDSLLAWRVIMGIVEALYIPAALGLIAVWHSERSRSTALAIHGTAQFAGIVAGAWFGGWAAETIGWRQSFWALSAAGMIYAAVLASVFRRPTAQTTRKRPAPAAPLAIFRSLCYVILLFAFFVFCAMLWIFYGWLPAFVFQKFHTSLAAGGFTATVYLQAGSVAGVLTWGPVADLIAGKIHSGRFYIGALGLLICAPFAYWIVSLNSLQGLKLAAVAFGFFSGAMAANAFAAAYDVVSERNYGFATGTLNMSGGLGGGAAMLLVGWSHGPSSIPHIMGENAIASMAVAIALITVAALRFKRDRSDALEGAGG
jgi:MFS family permease